ncbi:GMC family oxidoreductase [Conexibacter sp. JD483]|uniref:FAD-dependent oxidoreductase n=1 Tax=unclassified Conexibacter TaxID=2627773 RepID=UPI00271EFAFA|nr:MULTISPECIES: GMC family oxidoreductase [unclassified Conexibacter]MDO8189092.1 GMC family oxidoreductase [Conexibacter sp. CPCC 205706]MDO8201861.1 GMC family oxidoreductase [Conexibacter sp. CPCC 205762]MDR9372784.1 GMC family oxidoreductase [Conexibacter sp. JD483]
MGSNARETLDVDWVVVGSGFGGSVSAMRLAEKGYSVAVIERGEQFRDASEMPSSSWDLKRYLFAPRLGMRGIFRLSFFKDALVMSGAGVGGGSLVYAMTLYVPPRAFFHDPQWAALGDWEQELAPHFETAQRMLGVTDVTGEDPADQLLKRYGEQLGVGHTYRKARVGAYLENPAREVEDPYFGGEGPRRVGCREEGRCMLGCPHGSKNSTDKNYLHFAQRWGARIIAGREVVGLRPLGGADGGDGWLVTHRRTGSRGARGDVTIRAGGVVLAGGALGTNELLARVRLAGELPGVSQRLGKLIRTNSEAVLVVSVPEGRAEAISKRVAITSSIYPDAHTHVETVTYGAGGGAIRGLFTVLTGGGNRLTRPLKWLTQMVRHPGWVAELVFKPRWGQRSIVVLVMQTLDSSMEFTFRRKRDGGVRMQTRQDPERPNPTFIPVANAFTAWLARETGGAPGSSVPEALFGIPTTAHILGGAAIGADPEHGVVDRDHRVFGYENLLVCDGAAVPANVGVNPSLTIAAMAERAMSTVPTAPNAPARAPLGATPIAGRTAGGEPEPVPQEVPTPA